MIGRHACANGSAEKGQVYCWIRNEVLDICLRLAVTMAHTGLLDCVVVGAGPAGLAASKFLHKHELNYICLEAHTVAGGRARGQQGTADTCFWRQL
jgi:NADPH-dependent 2,4-dienoyl-CoA reductase/sulfur reductase-like enzyme